MFVYGVFWGIVYEQTCYGVTVHVHKGIWTMIILRWSPSPVALPFIAFFILGSCNAYEISQLPLPTNHMGLLTNTSLWLEQPNAIPSTINLETFPNTDYE